MIYYLLICRSLTYAQRAAKALEMAGIGAALWTAKDLTSGVLAAGRVHAFPAHFTAGELARALFWQLLPPLSVIFSGWMLCCRAFCTLLLCLRAAAGGYICCAYFCALGQKTVETVLLWIFLLSCEALAVLFLNSTAHLAERFMNAAKKGPGKAAVRRYLRDGLFFTGLLLILYFLRGAAVFLLVK